MPEPAPRCLQSQPAADAGRRQPRGSGPAATGGGSSGAGSAGEAVDVQPVGARALLCTVPKLQEGVAAEIDSFAGTSIPTLSSIRSALCCLHQSGRSAASLRVALILYFTMKKKKKIRVLLCNNEI